MHVNEPKVVKNDPEAITMASLNCIVVLARGTPEYFIFHLVCSVEAAHTQEKWRTVK